MVVGGGDNGSIASVRVLWMVINILPDAFTNSTHPGQHMSFGLYDFGLLGQPATFNA